MRGLDGPVFVSRLCSRGRADISSTDSDWKKFISVLKEEAKWKRERSASGSAHGRFGIRFVLQT